MDIKSHKGPGQWRCSAMPNTHEQMKDNNKNSIKETAFFISLTRKHSLDWIECFLWNAFLVPHCVINLSSSILAFQVQFIAVWWQLGVHLDSIGTVLTSSKYNGCIRTCSAWFWSNYAQCVQSIVTYIVMYIWPLRLVCVHRYMYVRTCTMPTMVSMMHVYIL